MTSDDFLRLTTSMSMLRDTISSLKVSMERQEANQREIKNYLKEIVEILKTK